MVGGEKFSELCVIESVEMSVLGKLARRSVRIH
jgi:hypothetical protein